jgi:hypothetical protein
MSYVIHKQLIPKNNLIWVLKLNDSDSLFEYDNLEDAEQKLSELTSSDVDGRKYKISIKNESGGFSDL